MHWRKQMKNMRNIFNGLRLCGQPLLSFRGGAAVRSGNLWVGSSWGILGASWKLLGASWGILEASWRHLGASWGILGASWRLLGASWGQVSAMTVVLVLNLQRSRLESLFLLAQKANHHYRMDGRFGPKNQSPLQGAGLGPQNQTRKLETPPPKGDFGSHGGD